MDFKNALLIAALLLTCGAPRAQNARPDLAAGYTTAEGYRSGNPFFREYYVHGVIDGYLATKHGAGSADETQWLRSCLRGMKTEQVAAIVEKYVASNPAEWHRAMAPQVIAALKQSCGA